MTEAQRKAADLLAQGIPAIRVAGMVGTSNRNLSRWRKLPGFADVVAAAAPAEPIINADTPVEQLRALARSPREDIALRASSKLADLEQKQAAELLANQPAARGATIFIRVHTDGSLTPHEVEDVVRDLPPGSQPVLHLESGPKPLKPFVPHVVDPVRYGGLPVNEGE